MEGIGAGTDTLLEYNRSVRHYHTVSKAIAAEHLSELETSKAQL